MPPGECRMGRLVEEDEPYGGDGVCAARTVSRAMRAPSSSGQP
jgi:hypothetical protein